MNHPRSSPKALAALVLVGAAVLGAAPGEPAAGGPVPSVRVAAEASVPSVAYLWAGSHTFDFSLDGGATTQTGYYQNLEPPLSSAKPSDLASGADVRSTVTSEGDVTTVSQAHRSSGDATRFTLPRGQAFRAATGWSVLAGGNVGGGPLRVWRATALLPVANSIGGMPVTGIPSGATVYRVQPGGSVRYVAVAYRYQGVSTVGLVDLTTDAFTPYATGLPTSAQIRYNDRWFATDEGPEHTLRVVRVGSVPGTEPTALGDAGPYQLRAVVGDHLVLGGAEPDSGAPARVSTVSALDGSRRTVLDPAQSEVAVAQDGGALATARDETGLWQVYHLVPGGDSGLHAWPSWIVGETDVTGEKPVR
ncbi:hypothetical protein [Streptomyces lancefieldiae]|uniref:Uncharacterized protein n=1 Tax=Streptomyces lancefieldiae TaxID=3075520 RepID=A0ABU3ARI2_9ACTN|nr:hypothetical protein [Streptomyces sp. DSM 40712]MDT0612807.1 hypothetical protein [Streptomyces sp. DSM 40712]